MNILNQLSDVGTTLMHDPLFLQVIKDHKSYLVSHETTRGIRLEPGEASRGYGSLSKILNDRSITYDLHQIIAVVNGLDCPSDYKGNLEVIHIPDRSVISQLISRHNTSHKML